MLPYFAAAGHNLYLKSAHVYLQTLCQLRDNNPRVYEAFKKGHHVIRRSDRYWAGLSTDLVIEQVLMRSVKTPTVTLDGEIVHVDPQLLFQRLTAAAQRSAEDIPRQALTYELCSVPSSLFDTAGFIREPQKPALTDAIWGLGDCSCAEPFGNDIQFVLDGGSLLQRIPWSKGTTFSTICNTYVNYVSTAQVGNADKVIAQDPDLQCLLKVN